MNIKRLSNKKKGFLFHENLFGEKTNAEKK